MKEKVYIETSLVSYLTSKPSRDLVVAAQQQISQEWWERRREDFELYASELVVQEAEQGDSKAAQERLDVLAEIPLLAFVNEAAILAEKFIKLNGLPEKASADALHVGLTAVYGIDYLLTWNCKHLANAEIQRKLFRICSDEGYEFPIICTPYELMGE